MNKKILGLLPIALIPLPTVISCAGDEEYSPIEYKTPNWEPFYNGPTPHIDNLIIDDDKYQRILDEKLNDIQPLVVNKSLDLWIIKWRKWSFIFGITPMLENNLDQNDANFIVKEFLSTANLSGYTQEVPLTFVFAKYKNDHHRGEYHGGTSIDISLSRFKTPNKYIFIKELVVVIRHEYGHAIQSLSRNTLNQGMDYNSVEKMDIYKEFLEWADNDVTKISKIMSPINDRETLISENAFWDEAMNILNIDPRTKVHLFNSNDTFSSESVSDIINFNSINYSTRLIELETEEQVIMTSTSNKLKDGPPYYLGQLEDVMSTSSYYGVDLSGYGKVDSDKIMQAYFKYRLGVGRFNTLALFWNSGNSNFLRFDFESFGMKDTTQIDKVNIYYKGNLFNTMENITQSENILNYNSRQPFWDFDRKYVVPTAIKTGTLSVDPKMKDELDKYDFDSNTTNFSFEIVLKDGSKTDLNEMMMTIGEVSYKINSIRYGANTDLDEKSTSSFTWDSNNNITKW